MKPHLTTLFFCCLISLSAQVEPLVRQPSLNPDGSQIAFSYQGDIWTVPINGGIARRMTIHESYEGQPQWSPDGNKICFTGYRNGNADLFVLSLDGLPPQRLTYHSTNDDNAKWASSEDIYFNTRRNFARLERIDEVHSIRTSGGTPQRVLDAVGDNPAPSPAGRYLAFERGSCRISREAYNGPANRDIWIFDNDLKTFVQVTDTDSQDFAADWASENELYWLSARDGRYNLYRQHIENGQVEGKPEKVTHFTDEGIRHFDLSADGNTIVFTRGGHIYQMPSKGGEAQKIKLELNQDYRFDPLENKVFTSDASDYAIAPNGKFMAFTVRGEIFVGSTDKDKKRTARMTDQVSRDQQVQWLDDSTLVFISDMDGNRDLFLLHSSDAKEPELHKTFKRVVSPLTQSPVDESEFILSPDRKKIAYRRGRGQLIIADISRTGLSNELNLLDSWATPQGLSWSPDSKWLAYSLPDLDFNSEIYIHPVDNSTPPVNVSLHPRPDRSPVWSTDGSKLGFLSSRNNADTDVWFVWLRKKDWEKTQRDWEETQEDAKEKKDSTKNKDLQIDFEDIHERLVQVTRIPGHEGDLAISSDGETFYYSTNGGGWQGQAGKRAYMSSHWDGKEEKTLIEDQNLGDVKWDPSGKHLYFLDNKGKIACLHPGKKPDYLGFEAKMTIRHQDEQEQIFEEAWRAMRDGFYDPNYHGQNWEQLREKYKARIVGASTTQDFRFYFNEMLGQLNASHMGLYGSNPEETQKDKTGLLGIEGKPVDNGFQITYVLPDSPADREDSRLASGEIITAVNGKPMNGSQNLFELLNGTTEERTLLSVTNNNEVREVIIRPASSLRSENYEAWVKERKELTDQYSGGKLGYIHIQGMNWSSFERFERELMASGYGKEGIIIDVRYNGGGWTTDMLMAVLNSRQHAYTIPRGAAENLESEHSQFNHNYPFGERLPFPPLTKPSIALCNENSYSNAEIFSHAYKTLGYGKLVGQPTFGAVISTGSYSLVDGSRIRMPFRAWYVKATGQNMEHGPAVPDVLVENAPEEQAHKIDSQLKTAVELLLKSR
ncbi:MAG: tricorn protease [Saprospiraceae bacterium]|nr:MAG: tricorn protease [Saprospiraceae bacterium]